MGGIRLMTEMGRLNWSFQMPGPVACTNVFFWSTNEIMVCRQAGLLLILCSFAGHEADRSVHLIA